MWCSRSSLEMFGCLTGELMSLDHRPGFVFQLSLQLIKVKGAIQTDRLGLVRLLLRRRECGRPINDNAF